MPRHILRLILLMGVFGVVAIGAKVYFTDKSFGRYGHYRADSVAEIAADTPIYRGAAYCQACHGERFNEWSAGAHRVVTCETCHGAAGIHPVKNAAPAPADRRTHDLIASARYTQVTGPAVPRDTVKLCTLCHERMPARPAAQPQIEVSRHAGAAPCITCHNPHSPRIAAARPAKVTKADKVSAAAAKAAQLCAGCHGAGGRGSAQNPPLAGKNAAFLAQRLRDYKSGARQNPAMNTMAKPLSEQEIAELAAYYASLKAK